MEPQPDHPERKTPPPRWLRVFRRIRSGIDRHHLPIAAAGVAFFLMLGMFPGLAALLSVYGWLADPADIERQLWDNPGFLPVEVHEIVLAQIQRIGESGGAAGWGAVLGIVLALWAGSRAMKGLVQGLNIVFSESEKRGFVSLQLASLSLTLAMVAVIASAIILIVIIPVILSLLPWSGFSMWFFSWLRWPVLLGLGMALLAIVYRYGPCRRHPRWKWVSPGAALATILWLGASALFSFYVSNFSSYDKTYGSLGAVVVLMLWLYITAYLILLGAETDEAIRLENKARQTDGAKPAPPGC